MGVMQYLPSPASLNHETSPSQVIRRRNLRLRPIYPRNVSTVFCLARVDPQRLKVGKSGEMIAYQVPINFAAGLQVIRKANALDV
jgi:hypothetical protein